MTQPRLILVTGASRGIGRSAALHLARQGNIVIAVARSKLALEKLDDEIRALGSEAVLVPMDLKDTKGIETLGKVIGGVCHGPLGLLKASGPDGRPLVEGRRISAVTDKQVNELGIDSTPHHPETELRKLGADFESESRFRDIFANHWVVDGNLVTGQNQNASPMVAREMLRLVAERSATDA